MSYGLQLVLQNGDSETIGARTLWLPASSYDISRYVIGRSKEVEQEKLRGISNQKDNKPIQVSPHPFGLAAVRHRADLWPTCAWPCHQLESHIVSRSHLLVHLSANAEHISILDTGSTHGTFLRPLLHASPTDNRIPIKEWKTVRNGDHIVLGQTIKNGGRTHEAIRYTVNITKPPSRSVVAAAAAATTASAAPRIRALLRGGTLTQAPVPKPVIFTDSMPSTQPDQDSYRADTNSSRSQSILSSDLTKSLRTVLDERRRDREEESKTLKAFTAVAFTPAGPSSSDRIRLSSSEQFDDDSQEEEDFDIEFSDTQQPRTQVAATQVNALESQAKDEKVDTGLGDVTLAADDSIGAHSSTSRANALGNGVDGFVEITKNDFLHRPVGGSDELPHIVNLLDSDPEEEEESSDESYRWSSSSESKESDSMDPEREELSDDDDEEEEEEQNFEADKAEGTPGVSTTAQDVATNQESLRSSADAESSREEALEEYQQLGPFCKPVGFEDKDEEEDQEDEIPAEATESRADVMMIRCESDLAAYKESTEPTSVHDTATPVQIREHSTSQDVSSASSGKKRSIDQVEQEDDKPEESVSPRTAAAVPIAAAATVKPITTAPVSKKRKLINMKRVKDVAMGMGLGAVGTFFGLAALGASNSGASL